MIRIVDHKKIEMTNGEYTMYREICRSYDDPKSNRKGEDLFIDLFEVNGEGIITFVKPPRQRYSSMEVFCFLISLMQNQHMRILYEQNKKLIEETKIQLQELFKNKGVEKPSDEQLASVAAD